MRGLEVGQEYGGTSWLSQPSCAYAVELRAGKWRLE